MSRQIGIPQKTRQLAPWKANGAQTVLVLEENDLWMTNHMLVADTINEIESSIAERPDFIFLLSTGNKRQWYLSMLRAHDFLPEDLSLHGGFTDEIDP